MLRSDSSHKEVPFLRRRFPDWPEEKMREAEAIYLRFLELQVRIFEEYELEKRNQQADDLTERTGFGIN